MFLSPRLWTWLAVGWTLVLLAGMLTPGSGVPEVFSARDKLVHGAAFFAFAFAWTRALGGRVVRVALLSAAFAVGTEVLQAALPLQRFGDPLDALADLAGAALGLAAALLVRRAAGRRRSDARA